MEHVGQEEQQHLLHPLQLEHCHGAGLSDDHKYFNGEPSAVREVKYKLDKE